jgi:hypothetical protein
MTKSKGFHRLEGGRCSSYAQRRAARVRLNVVNFCKAYASADGGGNNMSNF